MHDPNRIPTFCYHLIQLWEQYPDLRFSQIIELIKSDYFLKEKNFFYWEDEEVLDIIKRLIESANFNLPYEKCPYEKEEITNQIKPKQISLFDKTYIYSGKIPEIYLKENENE